MTYLILQSTYESVECALVRGSDFYASTPLSKHDSSAQLVPQIAKLLEQHSLSLTDLSFIAVNQGPGPFTTLRVVLATANGLSFGSSVPLVGVDGLHAMLEEHHDPDVPVTLALFNAFGGDVYYGMDSAGQRTTGWKNAEQFFTELKDQYTTPIKVIGSGALHFQEQIQKILGDQAVIPTPLPLAPSLQAIGKLGQAHFEKKAVAHQLMPLYLKRAILENRTVKFV